jgi:uncharacterized membrane protein
LIRYLEERMLSSDIPELNQLSHSFNYMAASLQGVEKKRRDLIFKLNYSLKKLIKFFFKFILFTIFAYTNKIFTKCIAKPTFFIIINVIVIIIVIIIIINRFIIKNF